MGNEGCLGHSTVIAIMMFLLARWRSRNNGKDNHAAHASSFVRNLTTSLSSSLPVHHFMRGTRATHRGWPGSDDRVLHHQQSSRHESLRRIPKLRREKYRTSKKEVICRNRVFTLRRIIIAIYFVYLSPLSTTRRIKDKIKTTGS